MKTHHFISRVALPACLAILPLRTAMAAEYEVPTAAWPTIQSAIDDAATNGAATNIINLAQTPIMISTPLTITHAGPAGFHGGRSLVVRPKPGIATLRRVSIVSQRPSDPILRITEQQNLTFADIDLLRDITNNDDLVDVMNGTDILFDRCRIGLVWPSYGSPGFTMVKLGYPKRVVIRNCILFSVMLDAFAVDVSAIGFTDPENSVYLYNNLIADYRDHGFTTQGSLAGQVIALRNNVFINDPAYPVVSEPTAVQSSVIPDVTVLSSHNTVYTDALRFEDVLGGRALLLTTSSDFLRLLRADAAPSFQSMDWTLGFPWDPNPNFYRLVATGPLHFPESRWGITITPTSMPLDYRVDTDIEGDARPGGSTMHTDRGPDQIEPGVTAGVADDSAEMPGLLQARRNPGPHPALVFSAPRAGELTVAVMDIAGRLVHRESRAVTAGESGNMRWEPAAGPGLYFYRATFTASDGARARTEGRCVVLR